MIPHGLIYTAIILAYVLVCVYLYAERNIVRQVNEVSERPPNDPEADAPNWERLAQREVIKVAIKFCIQRAK